MTSKVAVAAPMTIVMMTPTMAAFHHTKTLTTAKVLQLALGQSLLLFEYESVGLVGPGRTKLAGTRNTDESDRDSGPRDSTLFVKAEREVVTSISRVR